MQGCGNVMNNFLHMLKIISLCSATHSMYLRGKSHTSREQEDISLQLLLLGVFFNDFFLPQDGKLG